MAFNRTLIKQIGTSDTLVHTASASGDVVIGMRVTNRTASPIKIAALVSTDSGSTNYYLVGGPTVSTMGADVQVGQSLIIINGSLDKVVLNSGDKLYVQSGTASSADCIVSVLEN